MTNKKLPTEKLSDYKNLESIKAAIKEAKRKYPPRVGYSVKEMDIVMKKHIAESAERLRKKLRSAWKKNAKLRRDQYSNR